MIIQLKHCGIDDRLYCETTLGVNFYIESYSKGVLTIEPIPGVSIDKFSSMVFLKKILISTELSV